MSSVPTDGIRALTAAFSGLKIHDASPLLTEGMEIFFPNPAPVRHVTAEHATHGAAGNVWEIHEHSGAHVDAPYHFDAEGLTIDQIPVEDLLLRPFKKFDLTALDLQPGHPATAEDLIQAASRDGFTLEAGDIAIVDFGYDKYLPGGSDERENGWWGRNQPGLTEDACEYLAENGIVAVASDTSACDFAIDDGEVSAGSGHSQHFLPRGILIIECLRGLSDVPATGLIVALPLPLKDGTGSPARVLLLSD